MTRRQPSQPVPIAPTILALLKIQRPSLVSGHSLLAS
jgi:hypothetical protein